MHIKTERTCISCRNKFLQKELNRIVLNNDEIYIDNDKKISGRAVYICKNENCINKAIKSKLLNKSFKKNIDEQQYLKLNK